MLNLPIYCMSGVRVGCAMRDDVCVWYFVSCWQVERRGVSDDEW